MHSIEQAINIRKRMISINILIIFPDSSFAAAAKNPCNKSSSFFLVEVNSAKSFCASISSCCACLSNAAFCCKLSCWTFAFDSSLFSYFSCFSFHRPLFRSNCSIFQCFLFDNIKIWNLFHDIKSDKLSFLWQRFPAASCSIIILFISLK